MASMHLRYAGYLARHKLFVGQECFKRGLYFRGIIHDYDKFFPGRWMAYARFFSIEERTPEIKEAFGQSWRRHAYLNDHHHQHWVSVHDDGKVNAHEMTEKARVEMLCDWIGAHKAVGGTNLRDWWLIRRDTVIMAPKTKRWMDQELLRLLRLEQQAVIPTGRITVGGCVRLAIRRIGALRIPKGKGRFGKNSMTETERNE